MRFEDAEQSRDLQGLTELPNAFVRNAWYAVAWSEELGRMPLALTIMNEPVVFYRKEDGTAVALEDRCAHRRAPLSRGRVDGDNIVCGYHGFTYGPDGGCVAVPAQDRVPPGCRVRSYTIAETHMLIWIWMGDPELADIKLLPLKPIALFDDPEWRTKGGRLHLKGNYRLLIDNLLDVTHLYHLHLGTIAGDAGDLTRMDEQHHRFDNYVKGERWLRDVAPAPTQKRAGMETNIDFYHGANFFAPGIVRIDIGVAPTGTGLEEGDCAEGYLRANYNFITPESETTTHYLWGDANDGWRDNPYVTDAVFNEIHRTFAEDVEMIAAQQDRIETDPLAPEKHLRADAVGLYGRRALDHMLKRDGEGVVADVDYPMIELSSANSALSAPARRAARKGSNQMSFDLYAFPTPNNFKVAIALEEMQQHYDVKLVNMRKGEHKKEDYLELNPLGKMPFVVEKQSGQRLYGSSTILLWLADRTGRFLPAAGPSRAETLDQFNLAATDLGAFNYYLAFSFVLPEKDEFAIQYFKNEVHRCLRVMDGRLRDREYLAGDYSIADMAVVPFLGGSRKNEEFLSPYPNVSRWLEVCEARPAVQSAFAAIPMPK